MDRWVAWWGENEGGESDPAAQQQCVEVCVDAAAAAAPAFLFDWLGNRVVCMCG